MNKTALIVAGGSGLRMGTGIPKQFLPLNGKPILMHTIEKFYSAKIFDSIYVVLPHSETIHWSKLISELNFTLPHKIVTGGTSRYESVKNGLKAIPEQKGMIAIHDGVRPLVSIELIRKCMAELDNFSNAVPAIPIVDTLRKVEDLESEVVDRNALRAIQTPQCFHLELIRKAYENPERDTTDDASVFEQDGNLIHLVEGEKSNLKITVLTDLIIAEALIK